jgi:hypothetical protein
MKTGRGYGVVTLAKRQMRAHRASYEVFVGQIAAETMVLHRCDTPECINPDHLVLGDQLENMAQAVARDRHSAGLRHGMHKLTPDQVRAIRQDPRPLDAVAADYAVSRSLISLIRTFKIWRSIK